MLQHLKHQQEGLSHLIATIKSDLQDLKLIEQGLQETMSQRWGKKHPPLGSRSKSVDTRGSGSMERLGV